MSKERLGFNVEIEMEHLKKIVVKDDSLTISSRLVKYLIEQADQLQDLRTVMKKDYAFFDKINNELEEIKVENKRYREAIERAIGGCRYTNPEIAYILQKALEESK